MARAIREERNIGMLVMEILEARRMTSLGRMTSMKPPRRFSLPATPELFDEFAPATLAALYAVTAAADPAPAAIPESATRSRGGYRRRLG